MARSPWMVELKNLLTPFSLIVRKCDALDLPEKSYSVVEVEMTPPQKKAYKQMAEFLMAELEADVITEARATIYVVQLLKLSQICSGYIKTTDGREVQIPGRNPKIEQLKEIIGQQPKNERFILWARFRYDVAILSKTLTELSIPFGVINGDTPLPLRKEYMDSFNAPGGIRAIIGNPQAGGEGLTLVGTPEAPCTLAVRYSSDFSIFTRLQAEDRCHRIGMHCPVHYIDLICEESIEVMILKILEKKLELGSAVKDLDSIKDAIWGNV